MSGQAVMAACDRLQNTHLGTKTLQN